MAGLDSFQDSSNGWAGLHAGAQVWLGWTPFNILAMAGPDSLQVPAVARLDFLQDTINGWAGLHAGAEVWLGWAPFRILAMAGLGSLQVSRRGWAGLPVGASYSWTPGEKILINSAG